MLKEQKIDSVLAQIKVKCECSHVLYFPVYAPDIQICNHCGRKVYRNNKIRFKDIMFNNLKKLRGDKC